MERNVNPVMLTLARETRGLSQQELANTLGVSQGKISKYEQGLLNISEQDLNKISDLLEYSIDFFYESYQIYPTNLSYTRKFVKTKRKDLERVNSYVNLLRFHISKILKAVVEFDCSLPSLCIEKYGSPEEIARTIRHILALKRGPIENLTELVETQNAIIFPFMFNTTDISGESVFINQIPLIFVNQNMSGDRLRFTIAHELGHVIMHKIPNPDMEKEADRFASELLMPEDDIRSDLSNLDLNKLASLKLKWKTSMQALLMKAKSVNKIDKRKYDYLWYQIGKYGFKTREPQAFDIPVEQPYNMRNLLELYREELNFTDSDFLKLFGYKDSREFKKLYLDTFIFERKIRAVS